MKKEIIKVSGMSCSHCEARVNKALEELNGVSSSKASAKKGEVAVKFDEAVLNLETIKAKIIKAGYTL